MDNNKEQTPVTVSEKTKQTGEIHARWSWVEPCVWTERMLTALEQGVKGGVWFSLIDKVYSLGNLRSAFSQVKANRGAAGVDHVTIAMYEDNLETNLHQLHCQLKAGTYHPQAIRRKYIPKAGSRSERRPLGIPTVRDRVVQTALRNVLEPIFEKDFAPRSFGFRPNRSCKDALRCVQQYLNEGYTVVVDADLKSYFDTIPHTGLMEQIRRRIMDSRVLGLIEQFLQQEIMDGMERWSPETGSPQGAVISPLLSNIYLDELDHLMADRGFVMVRYADDLVILCRTGQEAAEALGLLERWVDDASLTLHPTKTRVVDAVQDGFDFLGYRFIHNVRLVSEKSVLKLKEKLRKKTMRGRGDSIKVIVKDVNRTLRGWFEYFKHSRPCCFAPIDSWLRMRLRCILRKQNKMKLGAWAGANNVRWPNAFFAELGLMFLLEARFEARRSALR